MANETAWPISSLVVNQHYKLELTMFTDNYITIMQTVTTRFDTVPTTSSNYGNKKSNPALMGKSVINPLTLTILYHTGPSPTA